MNIKLTKSRSVVIALIAFNVIFGGVLARQAYDHLNTYALQRTQFISDVVRSMVSEIMYVYYQELNQYSGDCEAFLAQAKLTLLTMPYIRSVSIADEQYLYCSTITQNKRTPISSLILSKESISLSYLRNSPLYNNADVISLILQRHDGQKIVFGMHPHIFQSLLGSEMNFFTPYLVINNYVISRYRQPVFDSHATGQVSNQYIQSGYSIDRENYVNFLLFNYSAKYILLLISSFFGGILIYLFIKHFDFMRISLFFALRRKEIIPYYQPIMDAHGKLHGVEVLARWKHKSKGMISPAAFISSAENSGQINQVFSALISQVIDDLKSKQHLLPQEFHLAFNISAPQLNNPSLLSDCRRLLYSFKRKIKLVLELTERVEIPYDESYAIAIDKLKLHGIQIALDDFGTGHSSLRYIKALKIDLLKVDKSFIDMISRDYSEDHIVANVLDLAKRIDIPVVAEGIESDFQYRYLLQHGVPYYQGFYFSRPLNFDQLCINYFTPPPTKLVLAPRLSLLANG